ncbi:MAG: Gfo/Idh/MocA family oxidoreductase [Candidatus Omnitrophica bacterium]|nr:Gfo/Idh/MocA family oxidoreductase [Candidatus Omnitrophota bacterium]
MEKIYNIGIIGFGFIGSVHAYGYENLKFYYRPVPLKAKLFGVCTAHRETAEQAKSDFGFEFATNDSRELINHPKIDIIHICSPNIFHREQVLAALTAGKHIYCDKPLVCSGLEAQAIEAALQNYSGIHQMTFHLRFYPATLKAKNLIEKGALGKIISFRIAYYHSGSVDPKKPMGWKQDAEMGGGVLADLGSHAVDLACFLAGEFDRISGVSRILYPKRPGKDGAMEKVTAEDFVIINARMKSGCLGVIEASKVATGIQDEVRFEIYGTRGALRFNSMEPNFLEFYDQSDPDEPIGGSAGFKKLVTVNRYPKPAVPFPGPKFSGGWLSGHIHCLENFLECIRDNRQANPSFYDGIYNVRLLDKVRISETNNIWV